MNPGGGAVAVWHRFNGTTHYFVQAAVRSAAGAWGATNLSPAGVQSINPDGAIDPHGIAVAAWFRFTATTRTPLAAVYQGTLCTVPKLVGKPLAKAKAALKKGHCRAGTVKHAHSSKIPAGRVLSQAKKPGTKLLGNAKVKLVVSLGV